MVIWFGILYTNQNKNTEVIMENIKDIQTTERMNLFDYPRAMEERIWWIYSIVESMYESQWWNIEDILKS